MLTVKTYLAPSAVHGIGLYAAEAIPARQVLWRHNPHIDPVYTSDDFLRMCMQLDTTTLQHLLNASYRRGGRYFYITDNARFINHSDDQYNIVFLDDDTEVSTRDIAPGEELLENYLLSYDPVDFFFQELRDPDPHLYLKSIQSPGIEYRA